MLDFDKPLSTRMVQKIVKRWADYSRLGDLSPHDLRRTAITRALESCLLLALYAFAVFGYVTATLATFFVSRDAESAEAEVAGAAQVESLRAEVAALREELRAFARGDRSGGGGPDEVDTPSKPASTTS